MQNTKERFNKTQETLDEELPLSFHRNFKLKEKNYKEFIENFLLTYRNKRNTYQKNGSKLILQCNKYRTRSLTDIYLLTKTYFPKVTLEECKNHLLFLEKDKRLSGNWCNDVHRMVYYLADKPSSYYCVSRDSHRIDEIGLYI